jgi:hypothetical protein
MSFTVSESPFVTLRKGDPSFQLQGPISVANRASILISNDCPNEHKWIIQQCIENGWIETVAVVPKNDPTLMWETLKQ